MSTTEALSLKHKALLMDRLKRVHTAISEYSFANLYLFRETHQYRVVFGDEICIEGTSHDGHRYLMPTVDLRKANLAYLKKLMKGYDYLFPVPEEALSVLDPAEFIHTFNDGDTDYVYMADKFRTYPGRDLHSKRNLMKQFTTDHEHKGVPLTRDNMAEAEAVLWQWQSESTQSIEETDFQPCLEALNMYDELVLCGGMYYADCEPAGFVIGEEISEDTFVLHFAKARTEFKGIYQYIFNNFASILPHQYMYINLEQDLEKKALREAKSSYKPDLMLRKARVKLRK